MRIFFNNLSGIPPFFSKSPQRMAALEQIAGRRIPSSPSTRWNFQSRTVNAVKEMREALIACCDNLSGSQSQHTGFVALGIKHTLESPDFEFWLNFFSKIMPHVDLLYGLMQSRSIDSAFANTAIANFNTSIEKLRNEIGNSSSTSDSEANQPKRKRRCSNYVPDAIQKCDSITAQCSERFRFKGHLAAGQLLSKDNLPSFEKDFPDKILEEVVTAYPKLNKRKLKTELSVLYERNDMWTYSTAVALSKTIARDNLHEVFSEILKLLKILVTPMTTAEPERCFSTLKRIKTFLRSTMKNERLSALCMLSVEKSMIAGIADFNEKVIDHFASAKNRRVAFVYK